MLQSRFSRAFPAHIVMGFWLIFGAIFQPGMAAADMQNANMQNDDPLNAEISIEGGKLIIRYSVRNGGKVPVYLTNKVYNSDSKPVLGPNNVYGRIGDDNVLELGKEMPRMPEGASPVNLVAPYMTQLNPGAQFDEEIVLDLPLTPFAEYRDNRPVLDDENNIVLLTAKAVDFTLGYYIPPEGAEAKSGVAFDVPVDSFINPKGGRATYGVMRSKRFSLRVPVVQTAAMR